MRSIQRVVLVSITILMIILVVVITSILVIRKNIPSDHDTETSNKGENTVISTIQEEEEEFITNISEDEELEEISYDKILEVTNPTYFYTVQHCIETYLNDIKNWQKEATNENKEKIYNQFSENYKQENNITIDNFEKYLNKQEDFTFFTIVRMVQLQIEDNGIIRFGVRVLLSTNEKETRYLNLIVYLDYWNLTYAIEQVDNNITDISQIKLNSKLEEILENKDNKYTYEVTSTDKLISQYFEIFKKMCFSLPKIAYEYLNNDYKTKMWEEEEDFEEYIFLNQKKIKDIEITEHKEVEVNGVTHYICTDQYGLIYVIEENAIMQFNITLASNL